MSPHRKKPPRAYHHGDLRNALLKAAREVLEERGPSFLGLREISRRVGVSAPSAYHHFPSRDALALGLAEQGAAEMAGCLAIHPGKANDALLPYGEAYVGFVRAQPRALPTDVWRRISCRLAVQSCGAGASSALL